MHDNRLKVLLRVLAGVSALIVVGIAGLRLYGLALGGGVAGDVVLAVLQILFPLTLGLFLGYIAVRGRIPGG